MNLKDNILHFAIIKMDVNLVPSMNIVKNYMIAVFTIIMNIIFIIIN